MRKIKTVIWTTTISLLAVSLSVISQGVIAHADETLTKGKEAIKVGTVDDHLPCSDKVNENFEGLSIDVWRRISERLNIQYILTAIPSFDEAVRMAAEGELDLVTSCHEVTPERLKIIEYAVPYTNGGIVIASQQKQGHS